MTFTEFVIKKFPNAKFLAFTEAHWIETRTSNPLPRITEAMKTDNWISVNEKVPMNLELVLVSHAGDGWVCAGELNEEGEWCNQFSNNTIIVTHWMPLPNPPKPKKP